MCKSRSQRLAAGRVWRPQAVSRARGAWYAETIGGALGVGNTYTQVRPVIEYEGKEGDLYLASIVEVAGVGHPSGDPVIGFWRIRDGKVIRHIFMYAPDYQRAYRTASPAGQGVAFPMGLEGTRATQR